MKFKIGDYIKVREAIGQIINYTVFPMYRYEIKWIKYSKYYPNYGSGFFNTYYYDGISENEIEKILTEDEVMAYLI